MKTLSLLCLTGALCLSVTGCSDREPSNEPAATTDQVEEAAPGSFSTRAAYAPDANVSYTGSACNLETINQASFGAERVRLAKTTPLVVTGWAYDEKAKQIAKSVHFILLDSTGQSRYFAQGSRTRPRPDVAEYLHLPQLVDVGFEAQLSLYAVEPGTYRMVLGIEQPTGMSICDVGRSILVE